MNGAADGGERPGDQDGAPLPDAGDVDRFAAEGRTAEAARRRRGGRWREARLLEGLGVCDVLLGALDSSPVVLHLHDASTLAGPVAQVGADVVELGSAGWRWWVALGAIDAVVTDTARPGDPADRTSLHLDEVLAEAIDDGSWTRVVTSGGTSAEGELRSVGASVILRDAQRGRDVVIDPGRITRVGRRGGNRRA